jgi:hypothetical protein
LEQNATLLPYSRFLSTYLIIKIKWLALLVWRKFLDGETLLVYISRFGDFFLLESEDP